MMLERNETGTAVITLANLCPGDGVYLQEESRPYRVQCRDERYIICTKPYNPKRTVMYFIIDLERNVRGPDDRVFCSGYETREQCDERLKELQTGQIEVSYRRSVPLEKQFLVEHVKHGKLWRRLYGKICTEHDGGDTGRDVDCEDGDGR